jgi:hypothetical protein
VCRSVLFTEATFPKFTLVRFWRYPIVYGGEFWLDNTVDDVNICFEAGVVEMVHTHVAHT